MPRPDQYANTYFLQLLNALSVTASLMPFPVIALGFLVREGILDSRFYAGDTFYVLISLGFILTAIANAYFILVRKGPNYTDYLFLSVAYHVLGVFFLLFISGVNSAFTVGWLILLIATDTYFGLRATILSLSTLVVTALVSFGMHPALDIHEKISIIMLLFFICVAGGVLSKLRSITAHERADLAKTRDQAGFQRSRLLALINSMGDAVITTDQNGIVRIYNAAALSLLDTNVELESKNINDVVKFRDAKGRRINIIDEAAKNYFFANSSDITRKLSDGEIQHLYVNIAPVQPGYRTDGERGFIFVLRDITKEKSLEQERDEFVSVVSHELRTPIAIAEGNLSNMKLMQERGTDPAVFLQALQQSHDQIMYLGKLVNDLGTLSRAERGVGGDKTSVDIAQLLRDMYNEYLPQATAKKLQFDLDVAGKLPSITTSELYLQEILQNLITNAIKYTPSGTVDLQAKLNGQTIAISVKDSGIGIGKTDQKHIFEKFYRAEDYRTRETNGTGLGLYVCRKLAEKLGFELSFNSRLNHGSTFVLTIPLQPAESAKDQPK